MKGAPAGQTRAHAARQPFNSLMKSRGPMARRERDPRTIVGRSIDRVGAKVVDSERVAEATYRLMKSKPGSALRSRLERAQCARILKEIKKHATPHHLAIIMDGNRRAARQLGAIPTVGHMLGRDKLEEVLDWCLELDIRVLTVYAFSTENFNRDNEEVQLLMDLFEKNYRDLADDERVHQHKIKVQTIGRLDLLPEPVQEAARHAEERTKDHDQFHLNVAVAYGGREELIGAMRQIARKVQTNEMAPDDITADTVQQHLYTGDLPDPDLVLRTSGEERISNFLLWQAAYAELYFADVYWPDLRKKDFLRAIRSYQQRQRRYGAG